MAKELSEAESVESIAKSIMQTCHADLLTAHFLYVFVEKASKKSGRFVAATIKKASPSETYLFNLHTGNSLDFIMIVALDQWNDMDEATRRATIDHVLCRCVVVVNDDGSRVYNLQEPTIQEFPEILRRHGAYTEALRDFVSVASEFAELLDPMAEDVGQTATVQSGIAEV